MKERAVKSGEEKCIPVRNVLIASLVVLLFTGIILVYYALLDNEKRDSIIKSGQIISGRSADQFEDYLISAVDAMRIAAYAFDGMIQRGDSREELVEYLEDQTDAVTSTVFENTTGLYAYVNGEYLDGAKWTPDPDYDPVSRPWYVEAVKAGGKVAMVEPYLDAQSHTMMMTVAKLLSDGHSVIAIDLSMERIQRITEEAVASGDSDIEIIFDEHYDVIAHSDPEEVGKNYIRETDGFYAALMSNMAEAESDHFRFGHDGEDYMVYTSPIGDGWRCISVKNATGIFRSLRILVFVTIMIEIVVVLILVRIFLTTHQRGRIAVDLNEQLSTMTDKYRSTRDLSERAIAENEAKTAFLSRMSHEFRTPINAVLGMNEMILRECEDSSILSYSRDIRDAGKMLLDLVNDLLDYSVAENGDAKEREPGPEEKQEEGAAESNGESFYAPEAKILAVDDNPINLKVFAGLLKKCGMRIDRATGGRQALAMSEELKYDLIFLDHMMPETDGIETLHEMKGAKDNPNRETPVICLTANAIAGAKEQYIAEGFDDYLAKPVDAGKLERMLLKYLPKEKLKEPPSSQEGSGQRPERIPAFVSKIGELDIAEGIKYSGGEEEYLEMLMLFADTADQYADGIEESVAETDLNNAVIRIHALKSSLRIIGAVDAGELALRMEKAAKERDFRNLNRHLENLLTRCRLTGQALSKLKAEKMPERPGEKRMDAARRKEMLAEIRDLAADCDNLGIEEYLSEMRGYELSEEDSGLLEKLNEAFGEYDFEKIGFLAEKGCS